MTEQAAVVEPLLEEQELTPPEAEKCINGLSEPVQSIDEPLALSLKLPWTIDQAQEDKFNRWIKRTLLSVLILFVVVQFLPVFELETDLEEAITKTTLIMEPKEVPEPPKPKKLKPEKPTPKKVRPKRRSPVASSKSPKRAAPKTTKPSVVTSQGLDALSTQLSSLASAFDTQKMRRKNVSNDSRGRVASNSDERISKDNITQRSSGVVINEQDMKANVSTLAAHQAMEVEGLDLSSPNLNSVNNYGSLRQSGRDGESVRRTFEATKSRLFSIYQRALSKNPNLSGKFTFKLVVEPNGSVSDLVLVFSGLNSDSLNQRFLQQIRQVNFGEADVTATEIIYNFTFFPS